MPVNIEKPSSIDISAGQTVIANAGEWIQYSTLETDGAKYIAVCLPVFSPETRNGELYGKRS